MLPETPLPFHEWSCLRSELVWIYEGKVRPESRDQVYERATGNWVWYLRKGEASLTTDTEKYALKKGMWLFVPAGRARQYFSDDAHLLSIRFIHQWPSGENIIKNQKGLLLKGTEFPQLEKRALRLHRLVRRHFSASPYRFQRLHPTDARTFLQFQATFLMWVRVWLEVNLQFGRGLTRLRSGEDRPLRAARCLNEAALDQSYPRELLQRETGLSEVHLNRLFLNEFDLTPRRYWDRRKMEFAKNCLETSQMSVKEISYRLGFRSDAHFAVWFRRLTSHSPSEYRATFMERDV